MARSGDDGLEQRLDRWVEAGRQLVDGVSGARPGSRRGRSRLNAGELGRWAQNKLDWLLDEESEDDWREPWQTGRSEAELDLQTTAVSRRRRPLEAISRRDGGGRRSHARTDAEHPAPIEKGVNGETSWPDDSSFSVSRWQREDPLQPRNGRDGAAAANPLRPLPRSTRKR